MDNYLINCNQAAGWNKFQDHCTKIYRDSNIVSIVTVYDYQLAQQFGFEFCFKLVSK